MRGTFFVAAAAATFLSLQPARAADAGSAERGREFFQDECSTCHQAVPGQGGNQGPPLYGVIGRRAGSIAEFEYSKPLTAWGKIWTAKILDAFLADPPTFIPGTKMPVNVGDAQDRADVIAFLAATKK